MSGTKKYLCGYCPSTFTSVVKHDEHFQALHRVNHMTGKVQPYKTPSIYAPEKRPRERQKVQMPDEVDLFLFDEDERRKPPPNPFG